AVAGLGGAVDGHCLSSGRQGREKLNCLYAAAADVEGDRIAARAVVDVDDRKPQRACSAVQGFSSPPLITWYPFFSSDFISCFHRTRNLPNAPNSPPQYAITVLGTQNTGHFNPLAPIGISAEGRGSVFN